MDGDRAEAALVVNIMLQLLLLSDNMLEQFLLGVSVARKLFLLRIELLLLLMYCDEVCIRTWFVNWPSHYDGLSWDNLEVKIWKFVNNPLRKRSRRFHPNDLENFPVPNNFFLISLPKWNKMFTVCLICNSLRRNGSISIHTEKETCD